MIKDLDREIVQLEERIVRLEEDIEMMRKSSSGAAQEMIATYCKKVRIARNQLVQLQIQKCKDYDRLIAGEK